MIDGSGAFLNLPTRKTGALLAYLGMSRDMAATREELATLLWGDCTDQQARQSLRQALALLRKEIGHPEALVADTQTVRLNSPFWSIDAKDFITLVRSSSAEDLGRAARLLSGEFLSGLNIDEEAFEEWVAVQRTRLQTAASQLCETFVRQPNLVHDKDQALAAADQLTALDPLREDWHRLAIALYARYRGRNEALALASHFASLLKRELGVNPEPETRALLDSLKAGEAPAPKIDAVAPPILRTLRPEPEPDAPLPSIPPQAQSFGRRSAWRIALAFTLLLIAFVGVAAQALHFTGEQKPAGAQSEIWHTPSIHLKAERRSGAMPIIILPFTVLGPADDAMTLSAAMLTDDLTNLLSRISSFRVISARTAHGYEGKAIDVARLSTELQVKYVVEGSIRADGENRRINVALIDAASRITMWSGRVDGAGTDRQGVRDEIAAGLARQLQVGLLPIESTRLSDNRDAGSLTYKGWAALMQNRPETSQQAVTWFNKALVREPDNLSALIGLGAYHAQMGAQLLDTNPDNHRKTAAKILREVLTRAPDSSSANFYLGLALNKLPTLTEAMTYLQRAIELNPSFASAYAQIGNAKIRSGRPAEGLEDVRYAMRLSPHDPVMPVWLEFAGNAELELAHYNESIAYFRRSIELNDAYPRSWAGLAAAQALSGQDDFARDTLVHLKAVAPRLDDAAVLQHFGRHNSSRLHEGLRMAMATALSSRN